MERIGNIGWQVKQTSPGKALEALLVRFHPNRYYGTMAEYITSGWKEEAEQLTYQGVNLPKALFAGKEAHYQIASVRLHPQESMTELTSTEDRLLYLEEKEKQDFFRAYAAADAALQNLAEGSHGFTSSITS